MNTKPTQLIYLQRITVLVLSLSLLAVALYAGAEKRRADLWQANALLLQAQLQERTQSEAWTSSKSKQTDAASYPVILVGKDGSETSLEGKSLRIDLGNQRLLEVFLARQQKGYLTMWAPAKREDKFFNRFVLHPHCANVLSLELDRVDLESDSADADSVSYNAPH